MANSRRTRWITAGLLAAAIFALLAAIVTRQARPEPYRELAVAESETLRAQVVEVVEEGTGVQGDLEQPYRWAAWGSWRGCR